MVNKILYCATVDYHFKAFHLPTMKWFKDQGWEVDVAASGTIDLPYTDTKHNIPIQRSPFSLSNLEAYKQLKTIIEQNDYSIIHCHTPLGGLLARLAARKARRKGTKLFYTAHGFHFFSGAPIPNWLIYYPIEKLLSRYTDCLLTINQEDYQLAVKHQFQAGSIEHIHGVGVDTEKFKPVDKTKRTELKKSFGYHADDFLLFYAAEFNKNKNQQFLLHMLALLKKDVPRVKLLLAGEGAMLSSCQQLASSLGISHMVDFLGFRKDIDQLLPVCDIAVASSYREGLPVNVMEAMACGLPVIAVDNRGHRELVQTNKTGWLLADYNLEEFAGIVKLFSDDREVKSKLGLIGRKLIIDMYSSTKVLAEKSLIYKSHMEEEVTVWAAN
ncbi:glycosyltransferase family 4 protein [Virgibacillus sp. C22-A2]|uniref:Glycosyltransferase family 4 protein n=1 Tax=Virgibacillus tibetensis TaxID=3042313 RepID=A0ABU6KHT7_9BACI|nr:glycosyltransferase family 4 protein [Virgibacillus sp. C22-A2]